MLCICLIHQKKSAADEDDENESFHAQMKRINEREQHKKIVHGGKVLQKLANAFSPEH